MLKTWTNNVTQFEKGRGIRTENVLYLIDVGLPAAILRKLKLFLIVSTILRLVVAVQKEIILTETNF